MYTKFNRVIVYDVKVCFHTLFLLWDEFGSLLVDLNVILCLVESSKV